MGLFRLPNLDIMKGQAVGLEKGFPVTKVAAPKKRVLLKGVASKRTQFVRSLVREVAGYAPYERRIMELLRVSKDKRALKFAKNRLGTHKRGKAKREEMSAVITAQKLK